VVCVFPAITGRLFGDLQVKRAHLGRVIGMKNRPTAMVFFLATKKTG